MKKKILFDLIALKSVEGTKYHGGAEYSKQLYYYLEAKKNECELLFYFDDSPKFIDPEIRDRLTDESIVRINQITDLPSELSRLGIDVFVSGLPYRYHDLNFGNIRCVFTIHGLRRIELPYDETELKYSVALKEFVSYTARRVIPKIYKKLKKKYFRDFFKCSRFLNIIVPSEHTKYSILVNFPEIQTDEILVSYSPLVMKQAEGDGSLVENLGKFYLMVSTHRWGKNAFRAVKAFDSLFSAGRLTGKVVLLGMNPQIFRRYKITNIDSFILENYVERHLFEHYLKNAYALIYPSLNEGFGYPPWEAMKYGTPVAMSGVCSLPEVYQNDVLFFNPRDINEIAVRILELEHWDWKTNRKEAILREAARIREKQVQMTEELVNLIIG